MLNWADANRLANVAAAQAHHALGVDTAAPPIDVRGAIVAADVMLMWRPLPRLFGVYINEPGSRPGILVNSDIPRAARRHTAAHELGHHWLGHSVAIDDGRIVDLDLSDVVAPARGPRGWTDQEKAAEAFAAWFLMPRRAVMTALHLLGIDRPDTADEVYQLALLLGTSFRATVRHLPNLRLAKRTQASAWMKTVPGRLKAELDPSGIPRVDPRNDVWRLHAGYAGASIRASAGDRLVLAGSSVSAFTPGLTRVQSLTNEATTIYDCAAVGEDWETTLTVTSGSSSPAWSIRIQVSAPPRGVDIGRHRSL